MAAGGAAGSNDAVGVHTEPEGILANPSNGGFGVQDALQRLGAVPGGHPVIGGHGDHAARGEVSAVMLKLFRRTIAPAAAEEEDDGGFGLLVLRVVLAVAVEAQFDRTDCFVYFGD